MPTPVMSPRRRRAGVPTTVTPGGARPGLTGRQRRAEARRRAEERRAEEPERRGLPTGMVAMAVAAVVALVAGIALYSGFLTPPGSATSVAPVASLHRLLGSDSADVTTAGGSGWVLDDSAGTIRRFDPSSGAWTGPPHQVARRPVSVAAGFGRLWVADAVGNAVVEVDPATGRRVGTPISVGSEPVSVAAGAGGVWVASLAGNTVSLVNPRTRTVTASVALPARVGAVRLTVGDGAVWVTGVDDTLSRISPKPDGVSLSWRPVVVGNGPIGLTVVPGTVWVADAVGGDVARVDPRTMTVTARYRVGGDPVQVAVFDSELWVGDGDSGTLRALDPATGRPEGRAVTLPGAVRRLVVTDAGLWAATANPGTVTAVSP
jgi:virginiamycin B lyase